MRRTLASALTAVSLLTATAAHAEPIDLPDNLPYFAHPTSLSAAAKRFHLGVTEIAALNQIADPHTFNRAGLVLPLTPATTRLPRYVAWPTAPARQSCASSRWRFAAKDIAGCDGSFCASGPQDTEVCACLRGASAVTISARAGRGPQWEATLPPSRFREPGPETFDVVHADFDLDGTNEVLVSWLEGQSNGIAAQSRTLVVVREGREILRYDSGELTAETAAVRVDGRCHLAAAHFADVADPIRGDALHLIERTFDPTRMQADPEIIARRFSDKTRVVLPFDPEVPKGRRPVAATISAVIRDEAGALASLSIGRGGSRAKTGTKLADVDVRLGDATSKRLFPSAFVFPALRGKKARVIRGAEGARTVLWLTR